MRSQHSVRTYLIGLIVGVLLPPLLFSGFLITRFAEDQQEAMAMAARNRTRIATATIEDELSSLRAGLFLLAGAVTSRNSDLGDFHGRAKDAFGDMTVVLTDVAGHEIVNTKVPFGQKLPDNPDVDTIRYVADTRLPRIADMSMDPITNRPAVTINVPVARNDQLVYVLSLDISPTLPRILSQLDLPDGWIATVIDRRGYLIGRSRDADRFVGDFARPEFLQKIQSAREGWVPGVSREGVPLFTAFAHTRLGGWTVSAGIPRDILLAPVRQTINTLILLGGLTLALAIVLAVMFGRRIASPVIGLVPVAEAVGLGNPAILPPTNLTEANVVAQSLRNASERLRGAAAEQAAATMALRQSEQKYRALAEDLAQVDAERTGLLNRMVLTQENERKRIARELHDSLAQYLTALHLKLDTLGQVDSDEAPRRGTLNELRSLLSELGRAVNRMAFELRPVILDEQGFQSAVEHYLEDWAEMAHLEVDTQIDLGGGALPPVVEMTLFRVLQEAATNVLRHAQATRVAIILEAEIRRVRLIVEDNGKGFPVRNNEPALAVGPQFGLMGIRERLALVHGDLDVESTPDHGTTLFITIPLEQRRDAA